MNLTAFVLITASAIFHAFWNLLAKKYHMSLPFYAAICSTASIMWLHVLFWTPVPVGELPVSFWISLCGSVCSDALIYCLGLVMVYRFMDMSSAYPVMRSLPLLMIAGITALTGMGKPLNVFSVIGMLMVFSGCLCVPLKKFSDFNWRIYLSKNMFFIIICACGTTGYTIMDSLTQEILRESVSGLDISRPVLSMTYYSVRDVVLSSTLLFMSVALPGQRKRIAEMWQECKWAPFVAGIFASFSYVLVLMAMNYVSNVTYVQMFRQLGLVVGVFVGIVILKERGSLPKFIGVALIVAGLILSTVG